MIVYRVTTGFKVDIEKVKVQSLTPTTVTPRGGDPLGLKSLDCEFFHDWGEAVAFATYEAERNLEKARAASECLRAGLSRIRSADPKKMKAVSW